MRIQPTSTSTVLNRRRHVDGRSLIPSTHRSQAIVTMLLVSAAACSSDDSSTGVPDAGPGARSTRGRSVVVDAGPFVIDGNRVDSRLRVIIKRQNAVRNCTPLHPVLSQVWRDPARQANLARVIRQFEVHPLDESMSVGRRLGASGTSDVVDAHRPHRRGRPGQRIAAVCAAREGMHTAIGVGRWWQGRRLWCERQKESDDHLACVLAQSSRPPAVQMWLS